MKQGFLLNSLAFGIILPVRPSAFAQTGSLHRFPIINQPASLPLGARKFAKYPSLL
jgi:hypothetical protein